MAQGAGYSFNSSTVSGSKVRDLAGYFLTGTIVGSAAITTGGKYSDGLNCTGGALQIASIDSSFYPVNTDGGLSVAAWVKLNTTTAAARCIASAQSGGLLNWAVYASNSSGNVEVKVAGTTYSTTTSIRDGAWHHVMLVHDKVPSTDTVTVYVDGVSVLSTTATTSLTYAGTVSIEAGRNVLSLGETLDGIIDDFRWWNDPVESSYVSTVMGAEQTDFQLAIYPFDDDTVNDFSVYNRNLTKTSNGSYTTGLYGRALQSNASGAGAAATVSFGDLDRLNITGWLRLDVAPTGSAKPILTINNGSGSARLTTVVNLDRTITATWVTVYGTYSVTSGSALTVGQWSRFQVGMNPTYVNIRLDSNTQTTTNTSNSIPVLSPTVLDLNTLYVGGDQSAGGQVTFDYLTFTKNFVDAPANLYWCGPPVVAGTKPANIARGVYEFNENTGTTANDKSAYANHLTLTAGGSWITGVQGSALGNNGAPGAGARKASGLAWDSSPKGWAVSGWVKLRTSSAGARFVVLRNGTSEVAHVGWLSGLLWGRLYGSGGNTGLVSSSAMPISAETWTHVALSCNGNSIQFYVNGTWKYATAYSSGTLLSPTELNMGGDNGDGSNQAVGDMDSWTLFDTPISGSNVAWLYANPGQFAAGAPVTQSRATTWNTKATVANARALSWDSRTVVSQTRSTTWNVSVALVAVTASRATAWNVLSSLTSVSALRATTWRVLARTSGTRSSTWGVEGPTVTPLYRVKFPTYKVPLGRSKPLNFITYDQPYALVKVNGEWITTAIPSQELLRVSENFYLGGYYYELTSEEAADLPPQYVEQIT